MDGCLRAHLSLAAQLVTHLDVVPGVLRVDRELEAAVTKAREAEGAGLDDLVATDHDVGLVARRVVVQDRELVRVRARVLHEAVGCRLQRGAGLRGGVVGAGRLGCTENTGNQHERRSGDGNADGLEHGNALPSWQLPDRFSWRVRPQLLKNANCAFIGSISLVGSQTQQFGLGLGVGSFFEGPTTL